MEKDPKKLFELDLLLNTLEALAIQWDQCRDKTGKEEVQEQMERTRSEIVDLFNSNNK